MQRFLIEREIPDAGKLTGEELRTIAATSNDVLVDLAPGPQWVHSYITDDRIYCVYLADDAEVLREHARRGGFPANRISPINRVIDPTTAEDES